MISNYTIQQNIHKIEETSDHEDKLYNILNTLLDIFPILNGYLFRYSPLGYLGEGIIALDSSGISHIREMRDDIRTLPIIYEAIQKRESKFNSGIDFYKTAKSNYIFSSAFNSVLVIPIFVNSLVLGYICSSEFEAGFKPTKALLTSTTYFGESIGKTFTEINDKDKYNILSRRELEVMKKIAMGKMTKEMAVSMDISESTVKQYVKTAINKLGAKNRTHAVAILFQNGIFS